jgi:hypothetical protein
VSRPSPAGEHFKAEVSEDDLRTQVAHLADAKLEGRGTGTKAPVSRQSGSRQNFKQLAFSHC